jgi:hypothetical protein
MKSLSRLYIRNVKINKKCISIEFCAVFSFIYKMCRSPSRVQVRLSHMGIKGEKKNRTFDDAHKKGKLNKVCRSNRYTHSYSLALSIELLQHQR